jgi:hypothetical protein
MLETGKFHQFKINKPKLEKITSPDKTLQLPMILSNRNLTRLQNETHCKLDAESMNSTFLTNDEDLQSVSTCNNTFTNDELLETSMRNKKKQIIKNKNKSKRNLIFFII